MITITNDFASTGRNLGNKLFTYAFAKSLADIYGYSLNVPNNSYIQRCGVVEKFPFNSNDGIAINEPSHYISDMCLYNRGLESIIKEVENHNTMLDGYFLKYEYIQPFKEKIKNLYSSLRSPRDNKNDCIILLRDSGSDSSFKLPNDYYIDLLKKLTFDNLYISYDQLHKHEALISKLQKFNPILLDLNILDLMRFITTKKILITSQGTFSFWAAFLSEAEVIYWPVTNIGPNCPSWCVNLTINDDPRINFVKVDI